MSDEIQLISDGDGLAVIGDPALVDNFLLSEGLSGKELNVSRLSSTFSSASTIAQTASDLSANSGRWMKLTKESSEAMKKFDLVKNKDTGFSHAILRGENGKFAKNLQFENGMGGARYESCPPSQRWCAHVSNGYATDCKGDNRLSQQHR